MQSRYTSIPMTIVRSGFVALILLVLVSTAQAQDEAAPTKSWADLLPCSKFEKEMQDIIKESAALDDALPNGIESRDALLAGIFQGTQIMLAYGERMFEASDEYEDKCKAALRENQHEEEIVKIYDLVLTPTVRGYEFLERVRDNAETLDDQQTVDDMNAAIEAYRKSAIQLVDYCESDVPDLADEKCAELGKRLEQALKVQ